MADTITPYPNLDNWSTTLEDKVSSMLFDYFTSNADQSNIFLGKIRSFIYTISHYNHDPYQCARGVSEDLNALSSAYFKRSEVTVNHKDDPSGNGKYDLYIQVDVSDNQNGSGKFDRVIRIEGTNLAKLLQYDKEGAIIHEHQIRY